MGEDFSAWPENLHELLFVVLLKDMDDFEVKLDRFLSSIKDIEGITLVMVNPNTMDYVDIRKLFDQDGGLEWTSPPSANT